MVSERFDIQVVVDPTRAVRGTDQVERRLGKLETSAARLQKLFVRAFQFAGVGLAVSELGGLANEFTKVQNRLKTVTDGEDDLAFATSRLFDIANATRSEFAATAEVYSRVGLATKDLGKTTDETLQFVESLNQAVALSGASGQEASAGLIQLSQGLASGALRGDELRSVLEGLPVVADVIAKSLGVTRGELRELGSQGKISADIVLDAFAEAREELDERFGEAVPTAGQAMSVLRNNAVELFGTIDQGLGVTQGFSILLIAVGNNLGIVTGGAATLGLVYLTTLIPATVTANGVAFAYLLTLQKLGLTLAALPLAFGGFVVGAAAVATVAVKVVQEFENIEQELLAIQEAGENLVLPEIVILGRQALRAENRLSALKTQIALTGETSQSSQNRTAALTKEIARLRMAQDELRGGTEGATVAARAQIKALEDLQAKVDESIASIDQENVLLSKNSREREVQAEVFARVAKLERGDGPDVSDPQRERIRLAVENNQALQDQADILDRLRNPQLEFQAGVTALNALQMQGTITQAEYNQQLALLTQELEGVDFSGTGLESFAANIQGLDANKLHEIIEQLRTAGDLEGGGGGFDNVRTVDFLDRQAELYDQIRGPQERFLETQAELNNLLASGAITAEEYAIALNNARISSDQLSSSASQGLLTGLAQIENKILDTSGLISNTLVNAFGGAEDAFVNFVQTGELEFSSLVDGLLADITRLLFRQGVAALFGGGGEAGFFGNLFGGARRDGGDVNPNQAFLVGEDGAELFTPPGFGSIVPAGPTAAFMSGAAAAPPVVNVAPPQINIMNITDPDEVPNGIESSQGEQAVMNVIRKNRRTVKSL